MKNSLSLKTEYVSQGYNTSDLVGSGLFVVMYLKLIGYTPNDLSSYFETSELTTVFTLREMKTIRTLVQLKLFYTAKELIESLLFSVEELKNESIIDSTKGVIYYILCIIMPGNSKINRVKYTLTTENVEKCIFHLVDIEKKLNFSVKS